jgi:hypothetical protein
MNQRGKAKRFVELHIKGRAAATLQRVGCGQRKSYISCWCKSDRDKQLVRRGGARVSRR